MPDEPDLLRIIAERNTDLADRQRQIEALRDERDAAERRVARLERELWAARHPAAPAAPAFPARALRHGDGIPR